MATATEQWVLVEMVQALYELRKGTRVRGRRRQVCKNQSLDGR
uniref:Serine palmitoyltransferase long chain base subunit 1 n=1 Tax=Homo sapiens TaxID=9606 RepID=A0A8I5QJP4_HUMAN